MGYFGGLGAGKGWLTYSFLVEPDILRHVLAATKPILFVSNSRVPADYKFTPIEEYIEAYERYLQAVLKTPEEAENASSDVCIGMAASLDKFSWEPCPDKRYKLAQTEEPFVNLGPLMLDYDGKQLHTFVMSNLYFGLEMTFPRVFSLSRDKHETLYETSKLGTHQIFENIKSEIEKATIPCRMRSPSREHRPKIRITNEMRALMHGHPGLKSVNLEVL